MTAPGQDPRRPEDATSWEEFRARSAAARAAWGPSASPTEARSQAALGLVFGFGAAVFWAGALAADGTGTWALLALAVLSTWMFARYFTRGVRRGAFGTWRYWHLVLLGGQWRARLARDQARTVAEQARDRTLTGREGDRG